LKPLEHYLVYTVAYHSYLFLRIFINASYCGNYIYLNRLNIEVIAPCTGVIFISIYLALLLSLSKNIKEVSVGLPLVLLIYFGNLVRILITGIFGEVFIENIHWIHEVAGYLIMPLFSVITTVLYLNILSRMRKNKDKLCNTSG